MEPTVIAKQMIDFQKTTFDNTFNAMVMLQGQVEKMANTMLNQASWLPEEGRKAIKEWGNVYKNERENFKNAIGENFKKAAEFYTFAEKAKASQIK
jgi:hypothetical protein